MPPFSAARGREDGTLAASSLVAWAFIIIVIASTPTDRPIHALLVFGVVSNMARGFLTVFEIVY